MTTTTDHTTAPAVLAAPAADRDDAIIAEMHRLETAQADLLLDHLGAIETGHRLLDGGSGRGGTAFMANQRLGCRSTGSRSPKHRSASPTTRPTAAVWPTG